jgi:sulfite reductase beta subunit-like hemoprotein
MLGARQLRALADAGRLGSDIVELTSRAGVQIRGLVTEPAGASGEVTDDAVDGVGGELERILTDAGLLPSATHDRVRNVLASPLGGRHPEALGRTDTVVRELDRLICADPRLADLPGRFVLELDDASRIGRTAVADIALRAAVPSTAGDDRFDLVLAGVPTDLSASSAAAASLGAAAARAFVDLRADRATDVWHVRDLPDGPAEIARWLGGRVFRPHPLPARRASPVGVAEQPDGRHAVSGLARLGRLGATQLDGLAEICPGPGAVRVSPWKTITIVDVPADESPAVLGRLAGLGFVVSPGSGWVGLTACAGVGACASARIDVRGLAARRVAGGRPAGTEHWSGCERRCGEPAGASITVGPTGDRIAVRIDGRRQVVATPADVLDRLAAAGR